MRILLFLLISLSCRAQNSLQVSMYCRDTLQLPVNSFPLVAYVKSSDPYRGTWLQVAGPSRVLVGSGDSVQVSGLVAGTYLFQYSAYSGGICSQGTDLVTVLPVPIPARKAKQINYDDGTIQTIP
jgi:hypothetical protein